MYLLHACMDICIKNTSNHAYFATKGMAIEFEIGKINGIHILSIITS